MLFFSTKGTSQRKIINLHEFQSVPHQSKVLPPFVSPDVCKMTFSALWHVQFPSLRT